jgi:PAS domain S-box-containing protein
MSDLVDAVARAPLGREVRAPRGTASDAPHGEHRVQFYEDHAYLCERVAEFACAGLGAGDPVVLIATQDHQRAFREHLSRRSFDVARAISAGDLVLLDAGATLLKFMRGDAPDPALFKKHVGSIVRTARASHAERPVRAYGEMVDLLWKQGNTRAAIQLEELWNELATVEQFSLLCGYALDNFSSAEHAAGFQHVCNLHSHVEPSEQLFAISDEDARHRQVAMLEQRARALDAEVKRREQVERELRRREEELRDFIENGIEGMHRVGPDGTILFANNAELELLGYTREEYLGRQIREFHVDEPVIDALLQRLARGEAARDYEARLRCKDGSIKHVLINSNVYFRDGEFVHTRCFTRDITDRKRIEEAARRAEAVAQEERQKLSDLFMQSPALIVMLRGDEHVFEFVNAVAEELLTGANALGKRLLDLFPHFPAERLAIIDHVFTSGERYVLEASPSLRTWQGDDDSSERFFNMVYEPYRHADGSIAGVMAFGFEVTGQIHAQRRVEAIACELENANRTKDEFLATVSHELRTPLNAILGWVRMLRVGGLAPEKKERALETIERNANAQAQLIEDLLDVSRIISGKMRLDVGAVDVAMVIDNALEAVRPAAQAKGVLLQHTPDAAAGPVLGDAHRLQQVVWNLLTNAVKFTPSGGAVEVAVHQRQAFVEIVVGDNGQGIALEFLPSVFERFRQADGTTTRKYGGLGLGLAIVRHLVELHGGAVKVESRGPGLGATFTVCLPLWSSCATALDRPPAVQTTIAPGFQPSAVLQGLSILVLDDEPDAREVLSEILNSCGARVSTAASAGEALRVIAAHNPQLIVSDIGMPDEDGYVFIRKLRAIPESRGGRTPAIALTAYTRFEDRTKALVAGFNMHVAKPVEPTELIAALSSLKPMLAS